MEGFREHLRRDKRLYFVFQLCRELKIDDPPAWFNAVPDSLVDWWLAFYLTELDQQKEQHGGLGKNRRVAL